MRYFKIKFIFTWIVAVLVIKLYVRGKFMSINMIYITKSSSKAINLILEVFISVTMNGVRCK